LDGFDGLTAVDGEVVAIPELTEDGTHHDTVHLVVVNDKDEWGIRL